jgi:hypothetical protein
MIKCKSGTYKQVQGKRTGKIKYRAMTLAKLAKMEGKDDGMPCKCKTHRKRHQHNSMILLVGSLCLRKKKSKDHFEPKYGAGQTLGGSGSSI